MASIRIRAVVGTSSRLRDEALADIRADWTGPVQVLTEPDDLPSILYGLEALPLFGDPPMVLLRADERWLRSHVDALAPQIGRAVEAGVLVLVVPALDQRTAFAKSLVKAGGVIEAGPPDGKAVLPWLQHRIAAHPQGAQDPRALAELLIERVGSDADALLNALEVVALHAGDSALSHADGAAVLTGIGQKPVWDLTGAILGGEVSKAIGLLHAGEVEPEGVLAALISELRRLAACSESQDDTEVGAWLGSRGNLFYARRRAQELGRKNILRLLNGAIHLQRRFRTGGSDPMRELELFVLHARRLIKGPWLANPSGQAGRGARIAPSR